MKKSKRKSIFKPIQVLIYIFMILGVLCTCIFLGFLLRGSFMKQGSFTFDNYLTALWNTSDFWFYFWNSMGYSIPILIATLIISISAGYAFA